MNRNLSKHPKTVRRLDGALTAWRYFHGPGVRRDLRDWRASRDMPHFLGPTETENARLFAVLVRFVEWMQAPISPWAGSPFVEFVDETGTRKEARRAIGAPR